MRSRFDEQLALLNRELIEMGALCEEVIAAAAKALMEGDTVLAAQVAPRAAISMVTGSVDAFVRQDVTLAHQVIAKDDVVDEDFRKVKATLIDWIAQRPDDGEYALDLLMIAKYFERIGDHATNIAGWVVFAVTGAHEGEEN